MKLRNLITIIILLVSLSAVGQKKLIVKSSVEQMSLGAKPCYTIFIPQTTVKVVKKEWTKKIEDRDLFDIFKKKSKLVHVKQVGSELVAKDVVIESITQDSINLYNSILPVDSGVVLVTFVQYKEEFINAESASKQINKSMIFFLKEFAFKIYKKEVKDEFKEAKSVLKKAKKKLKKLEKKSKNLAEDNQDIDVDNSVNQKDIELNEKTIGKFEKFILELEEQLDTLDRSDMKFDFVKDKIKETKKEKKKITKKNKSLRKSIRKNKLKKSRNETKIEQINKQIEEQKQVVEEKKAIADRIEQKLDRIAL